MRSSRLLAPPLVLLASRKMKLIEPITGGIVEQNDEDAIRRLTSRGFKPYLPKPQEQPEQPKRTTRKRTAKKEQ